MAKAEPVSWEVDGREVLLTSPDKLVFPALGLTKLDLARYFRSVGAGALRGVYGRPMLLKRYPAGVEEPPFFQKRVPKGAPAWIETATLSYASGLTADEVVVRDLAGLLWVVNLGCVDLNPHPVRAPDLEHPDELRIDLDPNPGVAWDGVLRVALEVRRILEEHGLVGFPKTSGSRGFHVLVPIAPRWEFPEVRRAALAVGREAERRLPGLATAAWFKEERQGVFVDYNQNAKDRTTASAWSVRPTPDARVSMPLRWPEVPGCDPAAFTVYTAPTRFAALGDPFEEMDAAAPGDLGSLLALAEAQERSRPPERPRADGLADDPEAGARRVRKPLRTVAQSRDEAEARAGLARWEARHPEVVGHLRPADILVDRMRGRFRTWTRIRINLEEVPEALRPPEEPPDPDDDPMREWMAARRARG